MKLFHRLKFFLVLVFLLMPTSATSAVDWMPPNTTEITIDHPKVIYGLSEISKAHELAVNYAALVLQEHILIKSSFKGHSMRESLNTYDLLNPVMKKGEFKEGGFKLTYLLVSFPSKQLNDLGTAHVVFKSVVVRFSFLPPGVLLKMKTSQLVLIRRYER